jgi:hypothetical protein
MSSPIVFKFLKSAVQYMAMYKQGGSRCKTGSFDLQNVAINRHQSLMHG